MPGWKEFQPGFLLIIEDTKTSGIGKVIEGLTALLVRSGMKVAKIGHSRPFFGVIFNPYETYLMMNHFLLIANAPAPRRMCSKTSPFGVWLCSPKSKIIVSDDLFEAKSPISRESDHFEGSPRLQPQTAILREAGSLLALTRTQIFLFKPTDLKAKCLSLGY